MGGPRRATRRRMLGAVLGTALSVVPLVLVQQVADGMIAGIVDRFLATGTYHLQLRPYFEVDAQQTLDLVDRLSGVSGAQLVAAERQGYGLLYSATGRTGVTIRAVTPHYWRDDPEVHQYLRVVHGSFDLSDPNAIVLGQEAAQALAVEVGDNVRLLTVRPLGEGRLLPRVSTFTVAAIVSSGYRDLDRLWVFIDFDRGRRIISDDAAQDRIGIKINQPYALPNPLFWRGLRGIARQSERDRTWQTVIRIAAHVPREWLITDWYAAERARYQGFLTSRNLLVLIMALVVAVAAVNTASSLVLLVVEHEDEIAMLKATGVRSATIGGAFVAAAAMVGVLGSAIGAAVGLALAAQINVVLTALEWLIARLGGTVTILSSDYYLAHIPVDIAWLPVVGAVALTITVAVVSSYVPARRVASIAPDRVLRRH